MPKNGQHRQLMKFPAYNSLNYGEQVVIKIVPDAVKLKRGRPDFLFPNRRLVEVKHRCLDRGCFNYTFSIKPHQMAQADWFILVGVLAYINEITKKWYRELYLYRVSPLVLAERVPPCGILSVMSSASWLQRCQVTPKELHQWAYAQLT
jgi:hypothetical protein